MYSFYPVLAKKAYLYAARRLSGHSGAPAGDMTDNLLIKMSDLYDDEQWADGIVLDLRHLEGTNSYCSDEASDAIQAALEPFPLGGIHWIDTGDYHYLSEIMLRKADRPFALKLYDHHSDEQETAFGPGLLSCGSWVSVMKRSNPMLRPMAPGIPVYVSLDLDVLSRDCARTNWDQGDMTLEALLEDMRSLAEGHTILGIDICGGLTVAKGASAEDLSVNAGTRRALLQALPSLL